jgi:hypothetical protein
MKGFSFRKVSNALAYGEYRTTIKDGDILLYEGLNLASRVIRWATRSRYSHAGIAVWWNDRLMVMEAVGRGVSVTPLSSNIKHYHGHVQWFSTRDEVQVDRRQQLVQFAQEELGKEYALWKAVLLGFYLVLKKDREKRDELARENKLYCSWYVAQVYNAAGLDLKKGVSDRFMTPEDIARSPLLVHKGPLKIFKNK